MKSTAITPIANKRKAKDKVNTVKLLITCSELLVCLNRRKASIKTKKEAIKEDENKSAVIIRVFFLLNSPIKFS